jgi:ADP-heptose:LPS heptosyltransferase
MAEPKRLLVIKLSALGDLFHAVPVVHRLKQEYGCPIDWVTQPEYVDLVRCHPDVDEVLAFPRKGGVGDLLRFRKKLRECAYDMVLDLQGLTKSGVVMGMAWGKRKIAPSSPRELCRWFANEVPPAKAESPHAMDRLFDTLKYLKIDPNPVVYPMTFPEVEALTGEGPRLAIAPRSRWPAKDWPEENFVALIRRLQEHRPWKVVILGGPADRDLGKRIVDQTGARVENLCGTHPLLHLGGLLKQIDVVVSNDSGPMHFAAAVGTPLVALFGPTDPAKTGPWGEGHRVIRPEPGPGGYPDHRSYKNGDRSLISRITVDEVAEAVEAQLDS